MECFSCKKDKPDSDFKKSHIVLGSYVKNCASCRRKYGKFLRERKRNKLHYEMKQESFDRLEKEMHIGFVEEREE